MPITIMPVAGSRDCMRRHAANSQIDNPAIAKAEDGGVLCDQVLDPFFI
jgi:hypothetical protein